MLAPFVRCFGLLTMCTAVPVAAQDDPLARGIAAMAAHDLPTARTWLEQAVRSTPEGYEANWRLALVLVDLGRQTPDDVPDAERDRLYDRAENYARRAVNANPNGADGHFVLANAVGQASLTKSKKERVERAAEIRLAALRAVQIDPAHSGAWHVLGRWHAEIQRLSGVEKFFARTFLGASIFDVASWDEAEASLRRAVSLDPTRIFHRLDLAEVLIDRGAWPQAREQLDAVARLPTVDPLDPVHKARGRALAPRVANPLRPRPSAASRKRSPRCVPNWSTPTAPTTSSTPPRSAMQSTTRCFDDCRRWRRPTRRSTAPIPPPVAWGGHSPSTCPRPVMRARCSPSTTPSRMTSSAPGTRRWRAWMPGQRRRHLPWR